jgi:hypothetical protein
MILHANSTGFVKPRRRRARPFAHRSTLSQTADPLGQIKSRLFFNARSSR